MDSLTKQLKTKKGIREVIENRKFPLFESRCLELVDLCYVLPLEKRVAFLKEKIEGIKG